MDVDDDPRPVSKVPEADNDNDDDGDEDDDDDPIVASYNVFTNPPPASTRKLLILQHPNKQGPLSQPFRTLSEVRLKPGSGMIEMDVPLEYHDGSYDRDKGMRWGQSLSRSMNLKNGGSHGLAGGFGVGVNPGRGGTGRRREEDRDIYDWTEAVRRDQILRTQTMGGQFAGRNATTEEECRWMVGVFKNGNLHLTPATSEIQLRPQLHHLDAATEQDRRLAGTTGQGSAVGGPGGGSGGGPHGPPAAPKAIHMTIKSNSTGDQPTTETMADRLRHVQTEAWQKLKYVDDADDEAWELYHKTLLYKSPHPQGGGGDEGPTAAALVKTSAKSKGKGKAAATADDDAGEAEDEDPLRPDDEGVANLQTRWAEEDYLRAVAGKDREGVLEGYGSTVLPGIKGDDVVEDVKPRIAAGTAAKGKGKAAAVSTAKAPPKAKTGTGSSRGSAMQID